MKSSIVLSVSGFQETNHQFDENKKKCCPPRKAYTTNHEEEEIQTFENLNDHCYATVSPANEQFSIDRAKWWRFCTDQATQKFATYQESLYVPLHSSPEVLQIDINDPHL